MNSSEILRRSYKRSITLKKRDSEPLDQDSPYIGTLEGYIAVFNSDSHDLGGYIEQIKPGAFADSLARNDVIALKNHNDNVPLGKLSAGNLTLEEDETGLRFELQLPDTSEGRDLAVLSERNILDKCSFGFTIEEQSWDERDGVQVCTLEKINLIEVSVGVTFPAYESTSAHMRNKRKQEQERARATAKLKFHRLMLNRDAGVR